MEVLSPLFLSYLFLPVRQHSHLRGDLRRNATRIDGQVIAMVEELELLLLGDVEVRLDGAPLPALATDKGRLTDKEVVIEPH